MVARSQTVLVVDDEPALVDAVTYSLQQAGFQTISAGDGRDGLRLALEANPDLVLLDLMLPGLDGLAVCRAIRARRPTLPIIMLTARDTELDRVLGLETGADDYVTKPFGPRELVARVRAVLRRAGSAGAGGAGGPDGVPAEAAVPARVVDLGRGVVLDRAGREVRRHGANAGVTPTEFRLLDVLAGRPGHVFTRRELYDALWGEEAFGDERAVDVHVRHLRQKLEEDASRPELLVTVRGFGYKLVPGRRPEPSAGGEGGGAG